MSPLLHDIFCYYVRTGAWKTMSARDVVERMRRVDRLYYANRPFFSNRFAHAYDAFMVSAFDMGRGAGLDPGLKTEPLGRPRDRGNGAAFSSPDGVNPVNKQYDALIRLVGSELGNPVSITSAAQPDREAVRRGSK